MPGFKEVFRETGVPQPDFMVVPHKGENLVWFAGARGGGVSFSPDPKISIHAVRERDVSRIAGDYVRRHATGMGLSAVEDARKALWAAMFAILHSNPGDLLLVSGKSPGWSRIKATHGGKTTILDVAVTKSQWIDISFRFLRHRDANGNLVPDTIWSPDDASKWVAGLNWIYGPQVNVSFDLWDAEWVTLNQAPSQPISRNVFLNDIVGQKPAGPDLTVFLVGEWGGGYSGHTGGTFFHDVDAAVVTDRPSHPEIAKTIDPFMLSLAHEIAHSLRKERGFFGHHDRPNVLLSRGIQSLRLDKQLVMDINPP